MLILICSLDAQLYAFRQKQVERCIWAIAFQPLPKAPPPILGAINLHGQVLPLMSLRAAFALPHKEVAVSDHFVIGRVRGQRIAFWVDTVNSVMELSEQDCTSARDILPNQTEIESIVKRGDEVILLIDLNKLIAERSLIAAI